MISGKDLDRAILQLWPFVICIQVIAGYFAGLVLAFLITWNVPRDTRYDLGEFWGFFVPVYIGPMAIGVVSVAVIALFCFWSNMARGYWNCFKKVYTICVRISWILAIPLVILEIILFLMIVAR